VLAETLARYRESAERHGVRLAMLYLPVREEAVANALHEAEGLHLRDLILEELSAAGIPHLDATPFAAGPEAYFRYDNHPNDLGNARLARALEALLRELLSGAPGPAA
jgi:SGNH hydrolase-like domain, acetyltransferase AlgX